MRTALEDAALDYSQELLRFNYSICDRHDQWHRAERFQDGADERVIDQLLKTKGEKFLSILKKENDRGCLRRLASTVELEARSVVVPILERLLELYGPNILLYLLLSALYWNYGEDETACRYLDMAAELDNDNVYVFRHRLLYTNDPSALESICRQILEVHPGDPVATETMARIEKGATPYQSPGVGEHATIEFVFAHLDCDGL